MKYLINLQTNHHDYLYQDLNSDISYLGTCCKLDDYLWALKTTKSSDDIIAKLRESIEDDDRIHVCRFDFYNAYNPQTAVPDWLNSDD